MTCGCNSYTITPSGGLVAGGSPTISDTIISGGIIAGGSAAVDLVGDPWDGMAAVWGLDESGNGTSGEYIDHSRAALNGTGGGGDSDLCPSVTDGVFCLDAQEFSDGEYISIPRDGIAATQAFTVSMWIKITDFHKQRRFFSRGYDDTSDHDWVCSLGHSVANHLWGQVQCNVDGTTTEIDAWSSSLMARDRWYHIAMTWQPGSALKVFIDGVQVGSTDTTATTTVTYGNSGYIARWNRATGLGADIMDVRLHPVARDAAYLKAEHDNYCSSSFYSVGDQESAVFS